MLRPLVAAVLALPVTAQQDQWFEATGPFTRIAVHDLPGLYAAVQHGALGRMLADPEIAEAFAAGKAGYLALIGDYLGLLAAQRQLEPRYETFDQRSEVVTRAIDWRDVHSFELAAMMTSGRQNGPFGVSAPDFVLSVRPTAAGGERVRKQFDDFVAGLRKLPPPGVKLAAEQQLVGHDALVMEPGENDANDLQVPTTPQRIWLLERDGLICGGVGNGDKGGRFVPFAATEPHFLLGFDVANYIRMMAALITAQNRETVELVLEAFGLARSGEFAWRLHMSDGTVQDDLSLALNGRPGGILEAMLRGMAPLPEQPLPANGMLQIRCAFDVELLVAAIDKVLTAANLETLTEQGMLDDLRRAWTGGAAFALARPGPGSFVPRVYASFGIVDHEALQRLLTRLHTDSNVTAKERELAGTDCTLLSIDGFPAALQPSHALVDDVMHFAESAGSLKALLQAKADGAPRALDIGKTGRPPGAGTTLPMFDLRYDSRAIHAAVQEVWMPLAKLESALSEGEAFVPLDAMPDVETVNAHLGPGRGVLRRTDDAIVLSMAGTLGGPETTALASAFGPYLSAQYAAGWSWSMSAVRDNLITLQLIKARDAVAAFEQREGRRPATLGELVAAGDLDPEPVEHDGKPVAKSSFRYYPEGLKVSPDGEQVVALLIAIDKSAWQRSCIDAEGRVRAGWGAFAESSIDAIEKQAKGQ